MKYLVAVDDCFIDTPGGMSRVAWDIALMMQERGHQVALVAARPPSRDADGTAVETHDGVRVLRYSRPPLPAWHPLRGHRVIQAAEAATREHLCGEKWDVVHMHSPLTGAGVLRAIGEGPGYLYTLHSPVVMEQEINWAHQGRVGQFKRCFGLGALQRIERQALAACARIHTLSEYSRRKVQDFHGLGARVSVVPHWRRPDLERGYSKAEARQRLGWPPDATILFTVRRLGPRYGLDVAIEAVAPLARQRRCLLFIACDGPLRTSLEALADSLGIGERVRFTGRLDDSVLALAYQAADLFLLPTRALECFGLIVLEALAFGCPVLSTDAGALPELMRPVLPQFVVAAGDVAGLRDKLEQFVSRRLQPPSPETLITHVERCFGKRVIAPRITALIEGLSTS
jgi:glycosyltransferase involved in cell wall biosynthesis